MEHFPYAILRDLCISLHKVSLYNILQTIHHVMTRLYIYHAHVHVSINIRLFLKYCLVVVQYMIYTHVSGNEARDQVLKYF